VFTSRLQDWVRSGARRVVPALRALGLTPNILTIIGLIICAGSAVLVALGFLWEGGLVLLVASGFDILDGALARVSGREQRFGAFLDSTVDRYAEAMTAIALLAYFIFHGHHTLEPMLIVLALTGSLLVSYVRARAQSLGFTVDGGLLARPERVVITVIGLVIAPLLIWALWILAVLTNFTAVQRIWVVWQQARRMPVTDPRATPAAPSDTRGAAPGEARATGAHTV
jgi:CDP-diacylglycerol---glycerol-3-phosphate 3-phosphatidyltransferase